MPLTGYTEKRSRCCNATLETQGDYGNFYPVCSQCKRGRWPDGVSYDFVYVPSDYERALEERIEALEKNLHR